MRRSLTSIGLLLALCGAPLASGCGASSPSRSVASPASVGVVGRAGVAPTGQVDRRRFEALRVHARELESRVALAEAEANDLRAQLRDAEAETRRRTVRIGAGRGGAEESLRAAHAEDDGPVDVDVAVPVAGSDRRPVLQLVGEPSALAVRGAPLPPMAPLVLPPAPPGVETRLPVVALPGADAPGRYARQLAAAVAATPVARLPALAMDVPQLGQRAELTPPAYAAPAPPTGGATDEYRAALELVHTRRLEQALAALSVFIERHPEHPHAEGARYWRAQVHYAQREYASALTEFEELVRLSPQGGKAADALLNIGLCHQRMGDLARAHLFFQRVLRQFPQSDAARAAARQDAS